LQVSLKITENDSFLDLLRMLLIPVYAAIHEAAGPYLESATKSAYKGVRATAGKTYPVELPAESPLRIKEGVHYVIHVLGPNMNPQRPDCLYGDYEKGCELLEKAYTSMLNDFARLAGYVFVLLVFSNFLEFFRKDLSTTRISQILGEKVMPLCFL
jgi:hypothetical protein